MIRIPPGVPRDTSAEADAVQRRLTGGLSPIDRIRAAFDASMLVRKFQRMGIESQHPDFTDEQIEAHLLDLLYGPEAPK